MYRAWCMHVIFLVQGCTEMDLYIKRFKAYSYIIFTGFRHRQ